MASTTASSGSEGLGGLARFVGVAWIAQCVFLLGAVGGALILFRVPLRRFIHYCREPFVIAFATTSSAAALPQTLENMERFRRAQAHPGDGGAAELELQPQRQRHSPGDGDAAVAQAARIDLTLEQQILILLTLKLTSKGVAGVPRGNFVVLTALFHSFGLPLEGLAMLLGIDPLIDPVRTSVNVVGHCAAPAVIAGWERARLPSGLAPHSPSDSIRPKTIPAEGRRGPLSSQTRRFRLKLVV